VIVNKRKSLVQIAWIVVASGIACAQTQTVEYSRVFDVRHLAGAAIDPKVAPVPDVQVEICREGWISCFVSATTTANGKFSFSNVEHADLYYVKLSAPGFDQLRIKVHLRSTARKELVVRMYTAT
jgi:hypothetical protein